MMKSVMILADLIVDTEKTFSNAPGAPWMETAILIMVGLMVLFAAYAIFFIYRQKKKEEKDEKLRKEAEKEEQEKIG